MIYMCPNSYGYGVQNIYNVKMRNTYYKMANYINATVSCICQTANGFFYLISCTTSFIKKSCSKIPLTFKVD